MNIPLYILLGVLIFLIIFLIVILILKIRLEISYKKENDKKGTLTIVMSFFGGRIKKEIPIKENDGKTKKGAKEKIKEDDEELSFLQKIEKYQRIFEEMRYVWSKSRQKIRKNIFAKKISLDMSVGFEDAFVTGIVTGSLWAFVYIVVGFISDIIRISVPRIDIKPVYNTGFLETDAKCIIVASPANIIGIAFKILVSYYMAKKKIHKETKKEKAAMNYGNTN